MADFYWLGAHAGHSQTRAPPLWKKGCAAKIVWACNPLVHRFTPASNWSITMQTVRDP